MQEIMQAFPVQVTEAISVSWTIVNLRRMLCSWYRLSAQLHHP
jgi:hypothetical protein